MCKRKNIKIVQVLLKIIFVIMVVAAAVLFATHVIGKNAAVGVVAVGVACYAVSCFIGDVS